MDFNKFTNIFSQPRINRYYNAVNSNEKKAIKLYQYNIKLSQEMFSIISCFEIILRNAINEHFTTRFGGNWLLTFIEKDGIFDETIPHNNEETDEERNSIKYTRNRIKKAQKKLEKKNSYTHFKHIAELEFGVWCNFFNQGQYIRTIENKSKKAKNPPKKLLDIFPKRTTTTENNYSPAYIFNELYKINAIRNRIAHHEPICFNNNEISTIDVRKNYKRILMFLEWMNIDGKKLLNKLKLNRVMKICNKIDYLNK